MGIQGHPRAYAAWIKLLVLPALGRGRDLGSWGTENFTSDEYVEILEESLALETPAPLDAGISAKRRLGVISVPWRQDAKAEWRLVPRRE